MLTLGFRGFGFNGDSGREWDFGDLKGGMEGFSLTGTRTGRGSGADGGRIQFGVVQGTAGELR
jgi:hypothetical protein